MNDYYVDIHCHPNIKAFNSGFPNPSRSLWDNISGAEQFEGRGLFTKFIYNNTRGLSKDSQSNLYSLAKGKVKVAFLSLYPIEMGFFNLRKLPSLLTSRKRLAEIYEMLFGCAADRIVDYIANPQSYFNVLENEYQYINAGQGFSPCSQHTYKIASNFADIQAIHQQDPDAIALVLNIEGGHALGAGMGESLRMSSKDVGSVVAENIEKIKSWEFSPFSINITHHFWNQLAGQAKSIKAPLSIVLNQAQGLNTGITQAGWVAIDNLLNDSNGNRILIDIKHMSANSRREYYDYVEEYNKTAENPIPIFCSHTGISGFKTLEESTRTPDTMRKLNDSYFNNWSINLADDEIEKIYRTKGLIGIMFDKGVVGGGLALRQANLINNPDLRRKFYTKLILDNIFHIVRVISDRSAWDIVSIGSDFDGAITHIDHLYNAEQFSILGEDMRSYLHETQMNEELWYGYSPEELVKKVLQQNAMLFLARNYNRKNKPKADHQQVA